MNDRIKQCEFCGEDFVYIQKTQKFCKRNHYKDCEVCGKTFLVERLVSNPRTCSRKCRTELIWIDKEKGEVIVKNCLLCNDEFTTTISAQKYCNKEHTKECEVCGVTFVINKLNSPPRTCGQSCGSVLTHTVDSKEKRRINSLEKHGVEFPFQAEAVKKKIKHSLDNSSKNSRIGSKRWNKMIKDKYNVTNVSKLAHIKQKKIKSCNINYGVDNPMQSKQIHELRQKLMIDRYGVPNKKYINVLNVNEFMNLKNFVKDNPMNISELCNYFGVHRDKMLREIREQNVSVLVNDFGTIKSLKEESFKDFIKNKLSNFNVIINDRKILNGRELDFYFPDNKLAVEISPTRTHNTISGYNNSPGVSSNYHFNKFIDCTKENVELITIFDWYDWEKILNHIENKLNNCDIVSHKECCYKEINYIDDNVDNLLKDWNILDINLAKNKCNKVSKLIYNEETIAFALWSKYNDETQLNKWFIKPDIIIENGLNKIIENYIDNNKVRFITALSNCDFNNGDIYSKLGFELEKESKPQLNYYNHYYNIHFDSNDLTDKNINSVLQNIIPKYECIKGVDIDKHLISYGFLPVYNCGYRKWRLKI